MAYERKTYDVWDVNTDYGCGWGTEFTALSYREAVSIKRDYIENARHLHRICIVKRRVKKESGD